VATPGRFLRGNPERRELRRTWKTEKATNLGRGGELERAGQASHRERLWRAGAASAKWHRSSGEDEILGSLGDGKKKPLRRKKPRRVEVPKTPKRLIGGNSRP